MLFMQASTIVRDAGGSRGDLAELVEGNTHVLVRVQDIHDLLQLVGLVSNLALVKVRTFFGQDMHELLRFVKLVSNLAFVQQMPHVGLDFFVLPLSERHVENNVQAFS